MRLLVLAVGNARGTSEGALTDDFVDRAAQMGKRMGFPAVTWKRSRSPRRARRQNACRTRPNASPARVPDGAHVILLDAKGKGMTSEDFAEMLGALRDAGTKDLAFVIGGPDGLAPLPASRRAAASPSGRRPGRICWCARCWPSRSIAR